MKRLSMWLLVVLVFSTVMVTAGNLYAANEKIAVMWVGKSGMTNRVLIGFTQRARTTAPDMAITLKRELKNMKEAETLFREFESNMNGIVFLRSTGAEFLAKANPRVPCFVGGCNNPAYLGTVKNLNAPEGNVTGVTYFIPYQEIFRLMLSLFPNVKSVGLLLEKGHPGALIDQEGTREQCQRLRLAYNEVVASNREQLVDGAKKLSGKVDIFIISNTALAMDNTVSLLPVANAAKTPMFAFAEKPVKAGAVVGMVADDVKLGSMLADSVVEVVVKRKPISQVPVKTDPAPKVLINQAMMQGLDLKFPQEVMNKAEFVR